MRRFIAAQPTIPRVAQRRVKRPEGGYFGRFGAGGVGETGGASGRSATEFAVSRGESLVSSDRVFSSARSFSARATSLSRRWRNATEARNARFEFFGSMATRKM